MVRRMSSSSYRARLAALSSRPARRTIPIPRPSPTRPMARILITNIGELYTGDLASPTRASRSLLVEDGRIAAFDPADAGEVDGELDARGGAVLPGLVDGHVHPLFGEWTPTIDNIGWIGHYLHGGTTSMVSA